MSQSNHSNELSLRRCRTVMEYPKRQASTGMRWSEETPLVTADQFKDRILNIDRVWSAVAYCPFPKQLHPDFPTTPVVSEEQNCSLELIDGVPTLLFTMWQRDGTRNTSFTNRAFNLCANINVVQGECPWDTCRHATPAKKGNFVAPKAHPLHRANRHNFFDDEQPGGKHNKLPLLVVSGKGQSIKLKDRDALATAIMVNALNGRFTSVSAELSEAVKACADIFTVQLWREELFQTLTDFLWSGNHNEQVKALVDAFTSWCKECRHYPAWAVDNDCMLKLPKSAFKAVVLSSVSVYNHDYGLPHLSPDAFVEETRQLKCLPESKDFVWESGHTRSDILTSSWVKHQLQIRSTDSVVEVKTGNWASMSGERLNVSIEL